MSTSPPVVARHGQRRPPRRRRRALRYALMVTAAWLIATGAYFAFSDEVVTRLIDEQTKLKTSYEDQIAELRAQVDRIISQKLLDQEQVEQRVNALLQRQARISLSLDKVERKQVATVTDLGERIDMQARRMQSVLSDLGINTGRAANGATGGPFVPLKPPQSNASA